MLKIWFGAQTACAEKWPSFFFPPLEDEISQGHMRNSNNHISELFFMKRK